MVQRLLQVGSIPAWAGEPCTYRRVLSPRGGGTIIVLNRLVTVYPRVGGGTIVSNTIPPSLGVYPRVGGGTLSIGLSPRGRGNPSNGMMPMPYPRVGGGTQLVYSSDRSIPAWAGEPSSSTRPIFVGSVYPRVGGGTFDFQWLREAGSIPAWAGEP